MNTRSDDRNSARDSDVWRDCVAADLQAHRAEQHQLWGGIDEMMLARYEAGVSPNDERARVEQATRDHPALRECLEMARELAAEATTSPPATVRQEPDLKAAEH
jgi:hypothetical protein